MLQAFDTDEAFCYNNRFRAMIQLRRSVSWRVRINYHLSKSRRERHRRVCGYGRTRYRRTAFCRVSVHFRADF